MLRLMIALAKFVSVVACAMLLPAAAYAQASITGIVRDTSGAVLPGVTVEATSPALIEKARSVVTDGSGQYRVESLRPGLYAVTFTLAGFATVRREGIELAGAFTASVNAELRVGAVEETVTVTGETPTVDLQSTTRQRVIDRETIDTIPSGRSAFNMAVLTPGVVLSGERDVGGTFNVASAYSLSSHGGRNSDQQILQNGLMITFVAEQGFGFTGQMNPAATQEVTVDTSAVSAELAQGGVRIGYITKDGGNTFSGTLFGSFANGDLQGSNFTQNLKDRGLSTPNSIKDNWDINPGLGGPIKRDRLWFFLSGRYTVVNNFAAGMFYNRNFNNPNAWTYEPDLSRPASNDTTTKDGQIRLTWQATPKNKIGFLWHEQTICSCLLGVSSTTAPERANRTRFPLQRTVLGDWTSPITNRLLIEAAAARSFGTSNREPIEGLSPLMIAVTEQSTGLQFRSGDPDFRTRPIRATSLRGAVSYITGTHALKVGFNHKSGWQDLRRFDLQPVSYRFNNGVPNQITERALPHNFKVNVDHDLGLFAQDKWTINRLMFSYGVRYDYFTNSFPEVHFGPARLVPTRDITFPAQKNLVWHDITPKLGASYDLFGTGKTAVKVSLNKYVAGAATRADTVEGGPHPAQTLVLQTTRSWNDANRSFVPDCDLTNIAANGECGALANRNFGNAVPGATYDPDIMRGWGKRASNWELSAGVQHELLPRVAVDVSYFRRWYGNFVVTDNRAVGPADFDPFSITAPLDPRLPGGGGYVISELYDLKPAKFGVPVDNLVTFAKNFGKQFENWNGVDLTISARPRPGLRLQGGLSTGRTVTDNCEIVVKLDNPSPRFCHVTTDFLTRIQFTGSYTIPRADVLVSAALQSLPGPEIAANFNAPNAVVAPSLGRSLSGNAANVTANLVEPGTIYGERLNQLDVRVGKILRLSRTRTTLNVDFFNALNTDAILTENSNFAVWRQPTLIPQARFIRLSAQFDF